MPNARDAIHGTRFDRGRDDLPDGHLPALHAGLEAAAAARLRGRPAPAAPRSTDPRAGRRQAADPLQEPRHAAQPGALDALPRRRVQAVARTAIWLPLPLRQGRQREAGRGLHVQAHRRAADRPASGPTTTTPSRWRSRSPAACTARSRSPGARERRADREYVVAFAPWHGFQTINGRAFVGNTPVFESRVGETVQWDVLAMGDEFHTFHVHGHRWRTDGGRRRTRAASGPRSRSASAGARTRPARGSTTATWRRTWRRE